MKDKVTKCLGKVTQYNPLTTQPGALVVAKNCFIRRENIIEDRRGHTVYSNFASQPEQVLQFNNRVLVHRGTTLDYDDGTGTFASYTGSYDNPSDARVHGIEAFSNFYLTTSAGVKVFTDVAGTQAKLAGAPRPLGTAASLTGASGFLTNGNQCAYRSVLVRTDANSNVVYSYPSQRTVVFNVAAGTRNVAHTEYLPAEAAAGDVIQFYRTEQVSGTTSDASGDEMALVYQYTLTSTDISNKYMTFTDSVVDALRGASLYTSPSQEGIQNANERPPVAKDICLYKSQYMLYANTQTKQRLNLTMVGTTSLTGNTITLAGVTYNFGASEIISGGGSPQVLVSATGVAATDIDLTARSLVKVINQYASNTSVYAYYLSGPDDLPGQIMIEERGLGAAAFTVQASGSSISGMFFPPPPVSPSTNSTSTSTNQVQKNAIYFAKANQPEHVPVLNYLPAGPANKAILRVVALKDSAIIIKEEGIYRWTGETPQSFSIVPIDLTVICRAPESVAVLANQVYMLSNQGVVAISENGVEVVSHDIEPDIARLLTVAALKDYSFGFAYESERSYFLSTIANVAETEASHTWIYNYGTRTWVEHTYAVVAGVVSQSLDKAYFVKPGDDNLYAERKSFDNTDFADPESTITITAISGNNVDFSSSVTPEIGWVIEQAGTTIPITALLNITGGFRATMSSTPPSGWSAASATLYPSVGFEIEYHSWTAQSPDAMKQVRSIAVLADDTPDANAPSEVIATFRTNFDPETEQVPIAQPLYGWGALWGESPWGGGGDPAGYPTWVPRNKQYCTRINVGVKHRVAQEKISVAGIGLYFELAAEGVGR